VIAHIVLFRPAPDMPSEEREHFVSALEGALSNIPEIRRARVGRRRALGRIYDTHAIEQFPYAAILEFESEADLRTYLEHPAHAELGQRFFTSAEATLVHDFELVDGADVRGLLAEKVED
jgi:hypothetical protein